MLCNKFANLFFTDQAPSNMDPCRGWQVKSSVQQCNRHMLEKQLACDIKVVLTATGGHREIPVHRYMLISRSPVFEAMLCGDYKETSSSIVITDIEPDSFMELLRFMYYEDATLTADNVLPVLFAAKKYMVDGLVSLCLEFLKANINEDNVCTILNHCVLYDEKELIAKCLKFIGPRAQYVLTSEGFLNLSKAALKHILRYDRLFVDSECEVVTACKEWAVHCLDMMDDGSSSEAEYQPYSDEGIRKVLGDCLYQIRFATMKVEELAHGVGASRILNDEESRVLFCHLSTWKYHDALVNLGFNTNPRSATYEYCRRFWKIGSGWNYDREYPDAISFEVDRPIWIMGISVYGGESHGDVHDYVMELYDGTKHQWVSRCKGTIETDGTDNPVPILDTTPPHRLEPGAVHTVRICISGPKSYFGEGGVRTVRCGGVKFTFSPSSESTNETVIVGGQIPEIIFRRV